MTPIEEREREREREREFKGVGYCFCKRLLITLPSLLQVYSNGDNLRLNKNGMSSNAYKNLKVCGWWQILKCNWHSKWTLLAKVFSWRILIEDLSLGLAIKRHGIASFSSF